MKYRFKYLFLILILAFSCIDTNIAYSNWYIDSDTSSEVTVEPSKDSDDVVYKKVAYIRTNNVNTYYTSIESALANTSSGEIIVIPGTNPTITKDCTIKSGVTLTLPYDDNGDGTYSDWVSYDKYICAGSKFTFADSNEDNVKKYRQNLLTIKENITITNKGTLNIAGVCGAGDGNQKPTGQTVGKYCEILLESKSKIINYNKINLYGYIKESEKDNNSAVQNLSGSQFKMPFVIYDFRGGSYSAACNNYNDIQNGVFPFGYYDFPNSAVETSYNKGAKLIGDAALYASNSFNKSTINFIGTENDDCLFKLYDGYIMMKYNSTSFSFTTNDIYSDVTEDKINKTKIEIYGIASVDGYEIEYNFLISFKSSAFVSPISCKFEIYQKVGTLTIDCMLKFLSGSKLQIESDAKCVFNQPIIFYQGYCPKIVTGGDEVSPLNLPASELIVNGKIIINSKFGGYISSENENAKILISSNFEDSFTSVEVLSSTGSGTSAKADSVEAHSENCCGYIDGISSENYSNFLINESYIFNGEYWVKALLDIEDIILNPSNGESDYNTKVDYTIKIQILPTKYSSIIDLPVDWTYDDGILNFARSDDQLSATFSTPAKNDGSNHTYKVSVNLNYTTSDGVSKSLSASGEYTAKGKGGCILPFSKILMADGTYKEAGLIEKDDLVMSFNHENGSIEKTKVIINDDIECNEDNYDVIKIEFDNGNSTDFVYEHGFFDATLNKYVYFDYTNYRDFIGHEFIYINNDLEMSKTKLVSVKKYKKLTKICSPVTANNLNIISDNMLSIGGGIDGLFNIFEYDPETLAFDKEKMDTDIETFGLLEYESFEQYFPKEIYDMLPCKYLGVAIGKGMITWEIIEEYISKWGDDLMENIK